MHEHVPHNSIVARRPPRRGAALLVCLFTMVVCSVIVVAMLDANTLRLSSLRNSVDYERALYLAGAAVHESLAELEGDYTWRDGIPVTEFPAGSGNSYSATAADGIADEIVITGYGVSGTVTRTLQVTVSND